MAALVPFSEALRLDTELVRLARGGERDLVLGIVAESARKA
jgi:hypothetical protein